MTLQDPFLLERHLALAESVRAFGEQHDVECLAARGSAEDLRRSEDDAVSGAHLFLAVGVSPLRAQLRLRGKLATSTARAADVRPGPRSVPATTRTTVT